MARNRKGRNRKPKPEDIRIPWNLVLELEKQAECGYHICPICDNDIPGSKRNLRGHLRSEDHHKEQAVSYLVSWSGYYDRKGEDPGITEEEAHVQVTFITGTTIKLRLPGDSIVRKIRQHSGLEPTSWNFFKLQKKVAEALMDQMSVLIDDKKWLPLAESEE